MAHILIVDDDASMRSLIRTVLESDHHSLIEAQDGRAALDMLETDPRRFEIIILDLRMPGMDGFEFLSILQNQRFQPLVIILSAHSYQIPEAFEHMVNDRLRKPFGRNELLDAVNNLLGESTLIP